MNVVATVTGAWEAFATQLVSFLPAFFAALVILMVGWVGCNLAKRVALRILRLLQFDTLADRSGMRAVLERGGVKQSASEIVSLLIFWFLFLIVLVITMNILGLPGVTDTLNTIFLYIPKVVAAIVVLILGLYFANFLEALTRTSCVNAGLRHSDAIGRVAYYATTIFIIAAILQILDIAAEIVMWAFVSIFGAVCLALALAFGMGGRDVAARFLEKWLEEQDKEK